MATEIRTLSGDEAIEKWCQGREVWNQWAEENPEANVDFNNKGFNSPPKNLSEVFDRNNSEPSYKIRPTTYPFSEFNFPKGEGYVNFRNVTFKNAYLNFMNTKFGNGPVLFADVKFISTHDEFGYVWFDGAEFGKGDVIFENVSFISGRKGEVSFGNVKFGNGDVSFKNLECCREINFINTTFGVGEYDFSCANFQAAVIFRDVINADLIKKFSFRFANFDETLELSSKKSFSSPIDLIHIKTSRKILSEGLDCDFNKKYKWKFLQGVKQAADKDDIARLRRLKEIAKDNEDHQRVLEYKIKEMQASRWHKTKTLEIVLLEFPYWLFSNYGRSIVRPIIWLIIFSVLLAGHYTQWTGCYWKESALARQCSWSNALPLWESAL